MDMNLVKDLIASFGFPIFVTVWLLWERKTAMAELYAVIEKLTAMCEKIYERIDVGQT